MEVAEMLSALRSSALLLRSELVECPVRALLRAAAIERAYVLRSTVESPMHDSTHSEWSPHGPFP